MESKTHSQALIDLTPHTRMEDVMLPEKVNSNAHGARPVYPIITTTKCIRTRRLSIKNSLFTLFNPNSNPQTLIPS